jgi:hypothetical protein
LPATPPPAPLEANELEALVADVLREVEALRELPIGAPPEVRVLPPGAFATFRTSHAGAGILGPTGDDILLTLRSLAGLGLVAPDSVFSAAGGRADEIGRYDCREDLVTVADLRYLPPPEEAQAGDDPSAWRALHASLRGLLAHEALHALVRRHHPLDCPPDRLWPLRDGNLARRSLEEGDADRMLAAVLTAGPALTPTDTDLWTAPLDRPDRHEPAVGLDYLAQFPYVEGADLVRRLDRAGGNAALEAAYAAPPVSSSQVMHPERFFAGERPVRIELPRPEALLRRGYAPSDEGTVGEAGLVALFSARRASLPSGVIPTPTESCDIPPAGCDGLTPLPGVRITPPGMTLFGPLSPPDVLTDLPVEQRAPVDPSARADWSLRDDSGALRAEAWRRILGAADGWRGDRIALYLRPDQDVPSVLWATVWDTPCDAEAFRRELLVARPDWGACRRDTRVCVVGGLDVELGRAALVALAAGTTWNEPETTPFPFAPVPPLARLEERSVASLADAPPGEWPTPSDAGASALGPTVLRRWIDKRTGTTIPLPPGPFWRLHPAPIATPLAEGIVLEAVAGGHLAVAWVAPAAVARLRERLGRTAVETREIDCLGLPGTVIVRAPEDGEGGVSRVLIRETRGGATLVMGALPETASAESRAEFEGAFEAVCGPPATSP